MTCSLTGALISLDDGAYHVLTCIAPCCMLDEYPPFSKMTTVAKYTHLLCLLYNYSFFLAVTSCYFCLRHGHNGVGTSDFNSFSAGSLWRIPH